MRLKNPEAGAVSAERLGKTGILNAVDERRITPPTRERKVDFFCEVGSGVVGGDDMVSGRRQAQGNR
jgi:hypothetical protein